MGVTRLVGRDVELRRLDDALELVRQGLPRVVFVEGEPGSGKSSLLEAFVRAHPELTGSHRRVFCDEFEQELAGGTAELVLGTTLESNSPIEVGRQLLSWLGDVQQVGGVIVLVIDDAQWMDHLSEQAFRFALRRLRADSVLVVIARRPPIGMDTWHGMTLESGPAQTVRLGPLSPTQIIELAATVRGWQLDASAAAGLAERTAGVPLLVSAVLRDAAHSSDLASVPTSASTTAARMLASLPADACRLVEAVAVLDEPSELLVAGQIAQVNTPTLAAAQALRSGLLIETAPHRYACAHTLLRDAVLHAIPDEQVRAMHLRAAQWTTAERSLSHRVAAADRPDPELVRDLVAAAEHARRAGQFRLAALHAGRAKSLSPPSPQRDVLLLDMLVDLLRAGDIDKAQRLVAEVEALDDSARKLYALGRLARDQGLVDTAKSALHQAAELAAAEGDTRLAAIAAIVVAEMHVNLGEGTEALRALRHARGTDDAEISGGARTLTAVATWQTGALPEAIDALDEVAVSGTLPWEATMLATRGMLRTYAGRLVDSARDLDAALAMGPAWRPGVSYTRAYIQRAKVRYYLGDWDAAAVDTAAALAIAREALTAWSLPLAHASSVLVPAGRGQRETAQEHLDIARAGLRTLHSPQLEALCAESARQLAEATQDYEAVRSTLAPFRHRDRLVRFAERQSFRWIMDGWISASVAVGDLAEADASLVLYETMLARWPYGATPARLGWLKGLLAQAREDPQAARSHYADALADPQIAQLPFIHAEVLQTAGRLERLLGHRREAIGRLQQAHAVFHALRAAPYEQRCAEDLAACGLDSASTDTFALSERERDVASLVARGLTNKEVATELFVTAKTVEYHLGNIYAKLNISSRRELRSIHTIA